MGGDWLVLVADAAVSYREEGCERPTKAGGRSNSPSLCKLQLELHKPQSWACTSSAAFTSALLSSKALNSLCSRGAHICDARFQVMGLPTPTLVARQEKPDPEFPTVAFPNPEEGKGTWALAFETGASALCIPVPLFAVEITTGQWGCIKAGAAGRALRIALKPGDSQRFSKAQASADALPSCCKLQLLHPFTLFRPGIRSSAAAGQRP